MDGDPIIEVRSGGGLRIEVVVADRLEVGRDCTGLIVDDALLSRRHLALTTDADTVIVEDLGSRNGTTLDGRAVTGRTPLRPGQVLRAGATEVRLSRRAATEPAATPPSRPGEDAARNALRDTVARIPILPPDTPPPGGHVPAGAAADTTVIRRPLPGTEGPGPDRRRAPSDEQVGASVLRTIAAQVTIDPSSSATVRDTSPPGSTMTFLFSDIVGSTERTAAMGDRAWYELLTAHNRVIERAVDGAGGMLVKSIGDGYMVTFGSARAAVRCATSIQRTLHATPVGPAGSPVRVRIGLHTGEAIAVGGDLFGYHVNLAARVAESAEGGQILLSALTRAVIETAGDVRLGPARSVTLKGFDAPQALSEVIWGDDVRATVVGQPPPPPAR